ncbi:Uncharacterised protein [Tsukamurella paurometabola]|uniref:Uncharacterized protein n=2 Tax=Tsukamurella paurometabola TaxID=2061 RepID=D5UQY1_TSUPD|nr:hypothetical protein Tpau_2364 [Tsukamurella paurometabola DSM 20162]SUP33653.1 Uncharacterised protein [Tsukamurella paurometabola]
MEVLPSLARAAVARSFDPTIWPDGTAMDGDEVLISGEPAGRFLGRGPSSDGVLVTRVGRMVRSGPVVLCNIDGPIPPHHTLADVAWPGVRLAGARMRQLLIRGTDGARLAARVEVPADVPLDALIVLALTPPKTNSVPPALRSWCAECDEPAGAVRWTHWTSDDPRRNHDGHDERVHRHLERLA